MLLSGIKKSFIRLSVCISADISSDKSSQRFLSVPAAAFPAIKLQRTSAAAAKILGVKSYHLPNLLVFQHDNIFKPAASDKVSETVASLVNASCVHCCNNLNAAS